MLSMMQILYNKQQLPLLIAMYRVELTSDHQPHKCRCRHNPVTEVDPRELASNLIKYNPSLLKYLGKYQQSQSDFMQQTQKREDKIIQTLQENQPHQSIEEQNKLKSKLDANSDAKKENKESITEQKLIVNPHNITQQVIHSVLVKNSQKQKQNSKDIKIVSKNQCQNSNKIPYEQAKRNIKTQSVQQRKYLNNNYHRKNVPETYNISCHHNANQKSIQCTSCINQMKRVIVELAEKDPDLASRIYSSAQKSVLYKNYSLNNYDNAAMNPHNYRNNDGKLNIYQEERIGKDLK